MPPQANSEDEFEPQIGPVLPSGVSVQREMDQNQDEFGPSALPEELGVGPLPMTNIDEEKQALDYVRRRIEMESKEAEVFNLFLFSR
ncbi:unnamed protein product [Strongylus vulgaris]|uniref:Uncharacterized protein n=1 Tax=Strongylus vulgaris TaxID=40348 RepID=A0A3P7JC64_STRVU|nr:unnamed protein product [Strongylus vulgaris]